MSKAIGIDLGTTNSVAAFSEASVEIIKSSDNSPPENTLTKSIVTKVEDDILVGEQAYNNMRFAPDKTINSIKRLMGRGYADPRVQEHIKKCAYKVTKSSDGTENSLSVWIEDKEFSPEEIWEHPSLSMSNNAHG
jgi:molecular chaperone DnaK